MATDPEQQKEFYLSYKFITSLGVILRLLFPRFEYAAVLTIFSFVCAGAYEVVNYNSGTIIGKFYMALLNRDESYFWTLFWKATLIYFGQCLLLATSSFVTWLLYISMRKNLVTSLHHLYFRRNAYYQLNCVDSTGIDNPDQRITQDAERFCSVLTNRVFPYILISPLVVAFYTYKTWITAGPFGAAIIYIYFIIGVVANRLLVSPLTKWTARVERAEGDFRYKHVSVRNNAEESAFYSAADFDKHECNRFFNTLIRSQLNATLWKYPAQFLQNFFDYYGAVLSYLIQVFPIFIFNSYKDMDPAALSKQISNNAFFFIYLINSFTRLTDMAVSVGEMAGYSQRIAELIRYMRNVKDEQATYWSCSDDLSTSSNVLVFSNVSYFAPNHPASNLVSDLNFTLHKGRSLLITGSSGAGKSSLLRVVKKLWKPRSGEIIRNFSHMNTMFLPQRPYFPPGRLSLRQQVMFPRIESEIPYMESETSRILYILQSLHLNHLLTTCGGLMQHSNFEWQNTLSPGEQQRLSIARVLYHRPSLVFLDEATSSLSIQAQAEVYYLLGEHGISYVSTGHRQSLKDYHQLELHLEGEGEWRLIT